VTNNGGGGGGGGDRRRLRLCARDGEDLAVVAACLQDARIPLREMCFSAAGRSFMAAFTRFRRERLADPAHGGGEGLTQSRSALVFRRVTAVRHRGLDRLGDDAELELLTIVAEAGGGDGGPTAATTVTLVFAGEAAIRLQVEAIDCCLEDFGEPWRSPVTPRDHFGPGIERRAAG
jgi:hypothetical protein